MFDNTGWWRRPDKLTVQKYMGAFINRLTSHVVPLPG